MGEWGCNPTRPSTPSEGQSLRAPRVASSRRVSTLQRWRKAKVGEHGGSSDRVVLETCRSESCDLDACRSTGYRKLSVGPPECRVSARGSYRTSSKEGVPAEARGDPQGCPGWGNAKARRKKSV